MEENFVVAGFQFRTAEDTKLAKDEMKKIEYLENHMDYNNPRHVLGVYDKIIATRVFKTPVGHAYLQGIRSYLNQSFAENEIEVRPIPLDMIYEAKAMPPREVIKPKIKPTPQKQKALIPIRVSLLLNLTLVFVVIAMFVISMTGDNPTVLNYEKVVTNKYAQWDQELTQREAEIRDKERELNKE